METIASDCFICAIRVTNASPILCMGDDFADPDLRPVVKAWSGGVTFVGMFVSPSEMLAEILLCA